MKDYYDILSAVGSASSILSLGLTVVVFMSIRRIRQFYIFNARVPELNTQLGEVASNLSDHLNIFNGRTTRTDEILADAEVNLKSLRSKVSNRELKRTIASALSEIKRFSPRSFWSSPPESIEEQRMVLEQIYITVYKASSESVEEFKQSQWEK